MLLSVGFSIVAAGIVRASRSDFPSHMLYASKGKSWHPCTLREKWLYYNVNTRMWVSFVAILDQISTLNLTSSILFFLQHPLLLPSW